MPSSQKIDKEIFRTIFIDHWKSFKNRHPGYDISQYEDPVQISIEKSLKGLYSKELAEVPPKTHNLLYLLKKIEKKPDQDLLKFITKLNTASVATRYPDDLAKIQAAYTEEITKEMIEKSKDVLKWVKRQF